MTGFIPCSGGYLHVHGGDANGDNVVCQAGQLLPRKAQESPVVAGILPPYRTIIDHLEKVLGLEWGLIRLTGVAKAGYIPSLEKRKSSLSLLLFCCKYCTGRNAVPRFA